MFPRFPASAVVGVVVSLGVVSAQTVITPPQNTGGSPPAPMTGERPVAAGSGAVALPSPAYTAYAEGNLFRVSVPSNWRELAGYNTVTFTPDGAYGGSGAQDGFTHGMEIGIVGNEGSDLRTATVELVASFARANPNLLRQPAGYSRSPIGGRAGLRVALSNLSDATGQPAGIAIFTTLLRDGTLFYVFGVAPRDDGFAAYDATFRRVVGSIQFME